MICPEKNRTKLPSYHRLPVWYLVPSLEIPGGRLIGTSVSSIAVPVSLARAPGQVAADRRHERLEARRVQEEEPESDATRAHEQHARRWTGCVFVEQEVGAEDGERDAR